MREPFARVSIERGACGVHGYGRETEEAAANNSSRGRVSISIMNALIVEVVPRHRITRQIFQRIVRDSLRRREKNGLVRLGGSYGETVERPAKSTRPRRVCGVALMGVRENPFSRRGGIF